MKLNDKFDPRKESWPAYKERTITKVEHEEKIPVYLTPEELEQLHGLLKIKNIGNTVNKAVTSQLKRQERDKKLSEELYELQYDIANLIRIGGKRSSESVAQTCLISNAPLIISKTTSKDDVYPKIKNELLNLKTITLSQLFLFPSYKGIPCPHQYAIESLHDLFEVAFNALNSFFENKNSDIYAFCQCISVKVKMFREFVENNRQTRKTYNLIKTCNIRDGILLFPNSISAQQFKNDVNWKVFNVHGDNFYLRGYDCEIFIDETLVLDLVEHVFGIVKEIINPNLNEKHIIVEDNV